MKQWALANLNIRRFIHLFLLKSVLFLIFKEEVDEDQERDGVTK